MQTHINLTFADGEYRFALPLAQINELQIKTKKGIGKLFADVLRGRYIAGDDGATFGMPTEGDYAIADVVETVRLGLIGGGRATVGGEEIAVTPTTVQTLMANYVYPARPLREAWDMAASILLACIEGYEDPQKKSAPAETDGQTETDGSTTP